MPKKQKPTINEKIQKLFNIEVKSLDEENRTVEFCFSSNKVDRYGEIVDQKSWITDNYEKNPVILWGHDPSKAENVIGSGSNLRINQAGKSYITAQFDDDAHSSLIFNKIKKGILRTVSAGFIPHTLEFEGDTPVLKDNELLEVSVVGIPANPEALALDYKAGELKEADATYLIKSMREEADRLEAAMKSAEDDEPSVEDLQAKLAEAEARAEQAEQERDAAKAELAGEANDDEEEREDDPANGGDDDQPGAEAEVDLDDIDADAELTPELEAQIDAQLAEAA